MTALAFPHIWVPRRDILAPCRRWLERFTEGKVQRQSKLKRNSNGKIVRSSASNNQCCCEDSCPQCSGGSTPAEIIVEFSGISIPDCCVGDQNHKLFSGDPNGTYTLTQQSNPCVWELNDQTVLVLNTCLDVFSETGVYITLGRSSGAWGLIMSSQPVVADPAGLIFKATSISATYCTDTVSGIANTLNGCTGSFTTGSYGTGGTATINA